MESLARPDRSRSRTPLQGSGGVEEASPPRYDFDGSAGHLSAGGRLERSVSPGLDGQYGGAGVEERGMV